MTASHHNQTLPSQQTGFQFDIDPDYSRAAFVPGDAHHFALQWIEYPQSSATPLMIISGKTSCGKTHLLHIVCEQHHGKRITLDALKARNPGNLGDLGRLGALAIDDVDQHLDEKAERLLFHAIEWTKRTPMILVLAARTAPGSWPIQLPDLRSRLGLGVHAPIGPLHHQLLPDLLAKGLRDHLITIPPSFASHLAELCWHHGERSYESIQQVIWIIAELWGANRRMPSLSVIRKALLAAFYKTGQGS